MNTLAPTAWTFFKMSTLHNKAEWTIIINRMVNNSIDADPREPTLEDIWKIAPTVGKCHDFAVTKREMLLHFGYHAGELLLCEVALNDGEHHMVLLVNGLVLDNINKKIVSIDKMKYKLIRKQSICDPDIWES